MIRVKFLSTISCELVNTGYPITFRVSGVVSPVEASSLARLHAFGMDMHLPSTRGDCEVIPLPSSTNGFTVRFLDPATFPKTKIQRRRGLLYGN